MPPLLVTFGLSVIIQNALLKIYTADPQKMDAGTLEAANFDIAGLSLGVLPALTFAIAVAVIAALQWTFYHTALGRAFRAVSYNQDIAQLMGLALAVTAIFFGIRTSFDPSVGGSRLIFGFEAVIIGAFVGFGGYILFALTIFVGLHPLMAIGLAGVLGAIVAVPMALSIFCLRGAYFAIGTWVFAEVFRLSFAQISSLGGGLGSSLPVGIVRSLAGSRDGREALSFWLAQWSCADGDTGQ